MKKLTLQVEKLAVETFDAANAGDAAPSLRGTVKAHNDSWDDFTCIANPNYTCVYHCTYAGPTCFNQC